MELDSLAPHSLICLVRTVCLRSQIEEPAPPLLRVFNAGDADRRNFARTEATTTCSQVVCDAVVHWNCSYFAADAAVGGGVMVEAVTYGTGSNPSKHPLTSFLRICFSCIDSIPILRMLKNQWLNANKGGWKDNRTTYFTDLSISSETKGRV